MENGRTRWRCNGYFKTKCKASLLTYGKVVKVNHLHNHPPLLLNKKLEGCFTQVVTIIKGAP